MLVMCDQRQGLEFKVLYCFNKHSAILGPFLYFSVKTAAAAAAAKSLQSCLTLCDPIDGSPPGSAIPGILQAKTLDRVALSFSNA